VIGVVHHAVEEAEHIYEIKPKTAVQTASIQALSHGGVMPFDHHETIAL